MARSCLILGLLSLVACEAQIPDEGIVCQLASPDCPDGFQCCPGSGASGFDGVCRRSTCADAGSLDGGADGGSDAGSDGGLDAGPPAADPVEIAAGHEHSCLRLSDGRVECWGSNSSGQLGQGVTATGPQTVPIGVMELDADPLQIEASAEATCARFSGGIQCWGSNRGPLVSAGPLGVEVASSPLPIDVALIEPSPRQLALGDYHACAIVGDARTLECWGHNFDGQLGVGNRTSAELPVTVPGLSGVADVCAGASHTCAAMMDGSVQCWGSASRGQLGIGDPGAQSRRTSPTLVGLTDVVEIACALHHTCAITRVGGTRTTHCWGENASGETQQELAMAEVQSPTALRDMRGDQVEHLALGGSASLFATSGFTLVQGAGLPVHAFGANNTDQLGSGGTAPRRESADLQRTAELRAALIDVSAGGNHVCAIDEEAGVRRVLCWGSGGRGQIGNADSSSVDRPTAVFGYE